MDDCIRFALATDRLIDITTTGRTSGRPSRIETWFYRVDGRYYLSGSPGRRDWHANLLANPEFTFRLKESATADLPARATPVQAERRRDLLARILTYLGHPSDLESWLAGSPLVEVTFPELAEEARPLRNYR